MRSGDFKLPYIKIADKSLLVILKRTADDKEHLMDNFRIYRGRKPAKQRIQKSEVYRQKI